MNIGVIGLGSMGKRRCRLLKQLAEVDHIYGVDLNEQRRNDVCREMEIKCFPDLHQLLSEKKLDAVVISTPPLSHYKIICTCLKLNLHVFTEINLISEGYDEIISLAHNRNKTLFLSSTFLYRNEVIFIQNAVNNQKVNYSYHVGQYLPDWHPWESIHDFFVGDKRTNGCREIFAIDLPWIIEVFGKIKSFHCEKRKLSDLTIDYNDSYSIILTHENGTIGSLMVDVVSRIAKRELNVYGENIELSWKGNPDSLYQYNFGTKKMEKIITYNEFEHDNKYALNIIENAYKEELIAFLNCIQNAITPKYSFKQDLYTLGLIDQFEQ